MSSSPEFDEKREKKQDGDAGRRDAGLDPALRNTVQKALGQEIGPVRFHTGPKAEAEAERRGASAVTRSQDIYFARDADPPETETGKRLAVHELVHTLQQSGTGQPGADHHALEAEADAVAGAVIRGERSRVGLRAPQGAPQRQEKGKTQTPTITRHPDEITPVPAQGTIAGAGASIAYLYTTAAGALFVTLTLRVPEGVAVVVSPLTNLREGETYRVQNAEGTRARAVVISVDKSLRVQPKVQMTFTRGSASHVVIFQFPGGGGK
jgi:Domain of unknown function (DUF4157)